MGNDTICVTIAVVNCNIMNTWNINDNEYDRSWGWSDTLCTSMTKLNAKAWIMKRCFFKKKAIPLLKKGQKMILDRGVTIPQCDVKNDYYALTMHSWHRKSSPSLQSRHFQHALLLPLQLQHPFCPRELPKPSCQRSSSKQVWWKLSHSLSLVYILIRKMPVLANIMYCCHILLFLPWFCS